MLSLQVIDSEMCYLKMYYLKNKNLTYLVTFQFSFL